MPYAYLCDFDGTVAPADIGAELVRRFSIDYEASRRGLLEQWRSGTIGYRELTASECRGVRVTEQEALDFTRGFSLDPDFAPFVAEVSCYGDRVMVVSEGFDFYVRDQLVRAGLSELPWTANRSRFVDHGLIIEFPELEDRCDHCGNCKGVHVRRARQQGFEAILVGDGLSDRCGARAADRVWARDELWDWCQSEGIPAQRFECFADVAELARRLLRPTRTRVS